MTSTDPDTSSRAPFKPLPRATPERILPYPAQEGLVVEQRYKIIKQLGVGYDIRSTVWLSDDIISGESVVLKITGANSTPEGEHSFREPIFLQKILETNKAPKNFRNDWEWSIRELLNRMEATEIPIGLCKEITRQVLVVVDFLHRQCGIIHTDLKLDNFLLRIEETQGIYDGTSEDIVLPVIDINAVSLGPSAVVVSDLGVANFAQNESHAVISAPALRAPEVCIALGYGPPADMWSLGCVFFELATDNILVDLRATTQFSSAENALAQAMVICNLYRLPKGMQGGIFHKYYYSESDGDQVGRLLRLDPPRYTIAQMLEYIWQGRTQEERSLLVDFLTCMIQFEPDKRATAAELLQSRWFASP